MFDSNTNVSDNTNTFNNIKIEENSYTINELNKNNNISNNTTKTNEITKSKINKSTKKIIIVFLSFLGFLIIAGLVLLIGHLVGGWFKKEKDLVVQQKREENCVNRYFEIKNTSNNYYFEGENETQKAQNFNIITDFIVAVNKKDKIDKFYDFNEIDYLYESFLLIINITEFNETDSVYLGGMNIYEESKSIDDLIKNNNYLFQNISLDDNHQNSKNKTIINIPFAKFYFYENGTIDDIYFPQDVNDFYKVAIIDLIEKITPKLSKSLYNNGTNRRRLKPKKEGIYLNYEQIIKNGELNKTIIYEDKLEKNIDKNDKEYRFESNEINSKIIRTFNSSGDMIFLEMEGEAIFKSGPHESKKDINLRLNEEREEKITETNESYYNLALDEFKMNVTSNMKLIQSKIEPITLLNLNHLCQKIKLEIYKVTYNSTFENEKGNETNETITNESLIEINNTDSTDFSDYSQYSDYLNDTYGINNTYDINDTNITGNLKRNLAKNKNTNYVNSYSSKYKIVGVSFLGLYIGLQQNLYIYNNNGLRQSSLCLTIGSKVFTLSTLNLYQYYYSGAKSNYKSLLNSQFSLLGKRFSSFGYIIKASFNLKCYLNHWLSIDVINGEMYTKGYTTFGLGVSGSFGPNFIFISFGAEITGYIAQGTAYIQANTLLNSNSKKALFVYYKNLSTCRVDLEFYFSIWLIVWKKKFKETINLFKGFSSYEYFYQYL